MYNRYSIWIPDDEKSASKGQADAGRSPSAKPTQADLLQLIGEMRSRGRSVTSSGRSIDFRPRHEELVIM